MFEIIQELQELSYEYSTAIQVELDPIRFFVEGVYVSEPESYSNYSDELELAQSLHSLKIMHSNEEFAIALMGFIEFNNGSISRPA